MKTKAQHTPAVQPNIMTALGFASCTCGESFFTRADLDAHMENTTK